MSVERVKHWLVSQNKQGEMGEVKIFILANCEQDKRLPPPLPKPTGLRNSIFVIQLHLRICSCLALSLVLSKLSAKVWTAREKRGSRATLAS